MFTINIILLRHRHVIQVEDIKKLYYKHHYKKKHSKKLWILSRINFFLIFCLNCLLVSLVGGASQYFEIWYRVFYFLRRQSEGASMWLGVSSGSMRYISDDDDRGGFVLGSKPSGTHEVSSSLFPPIGTSPSQSPRAIRNASTMNGIKFMMIRVIIILYL